MTIDDYQFNNDESRLYIFNLMYTYLCECEREPAYWAQADIHENVRRSLPRTYREFVAKWTIMFLSP